MDAAWRIALASPGRSVSAAGQLIASPPWTTRRALAGGGSALRGDCCLWDLARACLRAGDARGARSLVSESLLR
ncbi:hypothetical protein CMQ_5555 [Grosmannia clavigera kw1407]|uniref:Uncharacterized protein n=1 Tax=Grosmannia clavigera (strain kw1407 / UAMH 11150) TaxID=655863 RepID=F0XSZ6_GROCL|nr:uncharacterized protein CMQ_5555 [Grosmannia clavigera kw1407]EFW99134.1 hypothetical protein CMQ_5555 [Grosmannia clavigera kw1407]